MNKRLIVIVVGPTASGKSELAIKIARKINGEIISADSRQIYKAMNIGTGKVEGVWKNNLFTYKGIPHYLIDEASPKIQYSAARFQKKAIKIIEEIIKQGKTPIICGGTGHWIDAVINNQLLPKVKPDGKLRAELSHLTPAEMFTRLNRLDPIRATNIDKNNPRRLIRALEIVQSTGKPVPAPSTSQSYDAIWIGLNPGMDALEKKIQVRLKQRLKKGMIKEVQSLHRAGLSFKKLESFGLEYKYLSLVLQKKITSEEMGSQLFLAIRKYAKRQMTWWKRNNLIKWFTNDKAALLYIQNFFRKELNK